MLNKVIMFATQAHSGQVRKVDHSPFIIHPLAVGCLLADAGVDEAAVFAGILHDTVEDTDVTIEDIQAAFGDEVTALVAGCSENKDLSWEDRKTQTIAELTTASQGVCLVTCADKIHNLQVSVAGIRAQGEAFFAPFNRGYADQKWYYGSIERVLAKRIPHHSLYKAYAAVFAEAFGEE